MYTLVPPAITLICVLIFTPLSMCKVNKLFYKRDTPILGSTRVYQTNQLKNLYTRLILYTIGLSGAAFIMLYLNIQLVNNRSEVEDSIIEYFVCATENNGLCQHTHTDTL